MSVLSRVCLYGMCVVVADGLLVFFGGGQTTNCRNTGLVASFLAPQNGATPWWAGTNHASGAQSEQQPLRHPVDKRITHWHVVALSGAHEPKRAAISSLFCFRLASIPALKVKNGRKNVKSAPYRPILSANRTRQRPTAVCAHADPAQNGPNGGN